MSVHVVCFLWLTAIFLIEPVEIFKLNEHWADQILVPNLISFFFKSIQF